MLAVLNNVLTVSCFLQNISLLRPELVGKKNDHFPTSCKKQCHKLWIPPINSQFGLKLLCAGILIG